MVVNQFSFELPELDLTANLDNIKEHSVSGQFIDHTRHSRSRLISLFVFNLITMCESDQVN